MTYGAPALGRNGRVTRRVIAWHAHRYLGGHQPPPPRHMRPWATEVGGRAFAMSRMGTGRSRSQANEHRRRDDCVRRQLRVEKTAVEYLDHTRMRVRQLMSKEIDVLGLVCWRDLGPREELPIYPSE